MRELRLTLLSDGSSDRALLPLLTWLLRQHHVESAIQTAWADLRRLPRPPRGLPQRIQQGLELYPCDLLFVHRDAERLAHSARIAEIQRGVELATKQGPLPSVVRVVPVRMQEAWLLFDEAVIRTAAGNPNGRQPLELPRLSELEDLPNPKQTLVELLRAASGMTGRRRKRSPVTAYAYRVAELIDDFGRLRALPAFVALETEIAEVVQREGWSTAR